MGSVHPNVVDLAVVDPAVGVPTRPYLSPQHLQPIYIREFGYRPGDFPVTGRVAASTLALPFSARLADEDVRYAVDALNDAVERQFRA